MRWTRNARLALAAGLPLAWLAIFTWVRLPAAPAPLPDATRLSVLRALRRAIENHESPHCEGASLERATTGPVFVSIYANGRMLRRHKGEGATLAAALAAVPLSPLPPELLPSARIKVDLITTQGPIAWQSEPLFAFSVDPGIDGLISTVDGKEEYFLPEDLIMLKVFAGYSLFGLLESEFGLTVPAMNSLAAYYAKLMPDTYAAHPHSWRRFRTESFIESADHNTAVALLRGMPAATPAVDSATLRQAAIAGGKYLTDKLRDDGSFVYEYNPQFDSPSTVPYVLPRHFGTAMYIAQLSRVTHDPRFRDAAQKAFSYIDSHQAEIFDCTGTVALAVLALTEYRMSGDTRYDATLRRMGDFLLSMQRPAGDFAHYLNNRTVKRLYYDGEAAFALVRLARAFADERYSRAAKAALDWLTSTAYDHFAGGFYFGEDHWTCMAAEEAYPLIDSAPYERFCNDYAAFLRRSQFGSGEGPDDFTGAYGVTPFLPPYTTPAASRTQAMISAYRLGARRGHPQPAIRAQVVSALGYLLHQQIRTDGTYFMMRPARAVGGFMQSPLQRVIRIDFIQHAGDAMWRGADLLDEATAGGD